MTSSADPRSLWPFFRDLDLLYLLQEAARVRPASHATRCWRDLQLYLQGLRNFSSWAMQSECHMN